MKATIVYIVGILSIDAGSTHSIRCVLFEADYIMVHAVGQ